MQIKKNPLYCYPFRTLRNHGLNTIEFTQSDDSSRQVTVFLGQLVFEMKIFENSSPYIVRNKKITLTPISP